MSADEGDWLELLVASERVDKWLDTIAKGTAPQRRQAVLQLAKEVDKREAYAEEARTAGAVDVLTKLISKTDDEEVVSACAAVIAACSGPAAQSRRVRQVQLGPHTVWLQEGELSEGLGARVWASAHILCRQLLAAPHLVCGMEVLELGSGCGLVGILAAKLGARQVTLTDYDALVLANLRICMARNAEENSDHDGLATTPRAIGWETDVMRVRYLDWSEAVPSQRTEELQREDANLCRHRDSGEPPGLDLSARFPCILGADLIYEVYHADLLAAVVAQRLSRQGTARLVLAIRQKAHLERLVAEADRNGLTIEVEPAEVCREDAGILGRDHEYEEGFVTAILRHKA